MAKDAITLASFGNELGFAKSASYSRSHKTLVIQFFDGSTFSIPVRLHKMVKYGGAGWIRVKPSDEQLETVAASYHGEHVIWDDIAQHYHISDLKRGV